MAKLLDCEPIGSVEVIDPTLIVEVDLAAVYLTMGDVQLPAISGSWILADGFASTYVVGVQFQYQPLDESSPPETTATQPKDRLGWATTSGIVAARQYAVSYRAAGNNVFGPWTTPETITAGSDMLVTDVSPTSPTNLANLDRLLDEALARFTADLNEEESREAAVSDTQRSIDAIGVVDPANQTVDMRNTARQIRVGGLFLNEMDTRVDEGLSPEGQIQQPVPYEVGRVSGLANDQVDILDDGTIVRDGVPGNQVLRVLEAEGFLGHDAFIRRSPSDGNLGGRMFFQKPLINTTLTGDLALDVYQSAIRFFDATTLYGVTLPISAFQPSIGGRIVVSTPAGIVTGDLGSTTALRAPAARIGNAPGIGYLTLVEGDATYSGRAEFFNAAGGRLGFVGLGNSTTLIMSAETGVNWAFDKRLDALAGAAVTGALTVSGLATLSGGAAVTGDITTTAALHAASFVRVRSGSSGYIQHNPGDATYTGFTEFYNAAGTRLGYMGYGSGSTLVMAAEGSVTWAFDKQLRMLAGAAITGDASVSGSFGIGTLSPSQKLHVEGNSYISGNVGIGIAPSTTIPLRVKAAAVADWAAHFIGSAVTGLSYGPLIDAGTNASDYALYVRNTAGTPLFDIRGDGLTTFNGVANFRETVYFNGGSAGLVSYTAGYSDGTTLIFQGPSGGGLALRTNNGTLALFAKSNGNVGIGGNFNPSEALDVTGNSKASTGFIGPSLTAVGSDINLKVATGQGVRIKVNGVDTYLFEPSGRLSLNHLTMGGLGLGEWSDWTPTPVAESGTATGLASVYAEVERHGKSVTANFAVSQTAIGTGTAAILVPLPYAAKASRNFFGMGKNLNTGADLRVEAVGSNLRITAANSYPFGSGAESLAGSITYQCA